MGGLLIVAYLRPCTKNEKATITGSTSYLSHTHTHQILTLEKEDCDWCPGRINSEHYVGAAAYDGVNRRTTHSRSVDGTLSVRSLRIAVVVIGGGAFGRVHVQDHQVTLAVVEIQRRGWRHDLAVDAHVRRQVVV